MGKDKHTFKKIQEAKQKAVAVTDAIDTIADALFDTDTEKNVFSVMLTAQLDSIVEQAHFFGELLNTYKKERK